MKKIIIAAIAVFSLMSACKEEDLVLPKPEEVVYTDSSYKIYNKANPESENTYVSSDGSNNFVIKLGKEAEYDQKITMKGLNDLKSVVGKYNGFRNVKEYKILPEINYEFIGATIPKGGKSAEVQVNIKNYTDLEQGNYILPVLLNVGIEEVMHLIFIKKDAEFVALSPDNKKPMPPGGYNCPDRKEPMKMVAYVETNDYDIRNMGQFLLKDSRKPVFDFVVIFAANMNYNSVLGKREIFFNDKLKPIVDNPEVYIKPLQDRGIKVIFDILPNHQGVGYLNFQSYEEALAFAKDLKKVTDKIGIDGWDIDEEYAEYQKQPGLPRRGAQSFLWYIKAMKEVMPDKLLTLYDYSHPLGPDTVDEDGKAPKDYIDYSWSDYSRLQSSYAGLPNERYGQRSVEANRAFSNYTVRSFAETNLERCNGLFMIFNINGRAIRNKTANSVLSEATKLFYGEECEFVGEYHKGPKDR